MKIFKKIGVILFIFILCISCMNCYVNADGGTDITQPAEGFISKGSGLAAGVGADGLLAGVQTIASILVTVGIFVVAIAAIILGIQYMTSPPSKQAALRGQMIGLLVSAVVIFGAYGIWKIAVGIAEQF